MTRADHGANCLSAFATWLVTPLLAVRTGFVLSAEIIVIRLGAVAGRALAAQIGLMIGIAVLITVGAP